MRVEGSKNSLVAPIRKDIVVAVLRDAVEKSDLGGFLLQAGRRRVCQGIVDPKCRCFCEVTQYPADCWSRGRRMPGVIGQNTIRWQWQEQRRKRGFDGWIDVRVRSPQCLTDRFRRSPAGGCLSAV